MAEEPDRLSQLPDELLQHILHLAPSREAESTAVLSRRWRGLWPPPTGAVKIDISSGDNRGHNASSRFAEEVLAAAHGPVERLAIHVGESCDLNDIVGDVLSHPASRGVQDVRISAAGDDDDGSFSRMPDRNMGVFKFSFGVVPSAALRVLHITNCCDLTTPPPPQPVSIFFPCLEVLRLRRCKVSLESLQDMVVASPQLAALQLEHVFLSTAVRTPRPTYYAHYDWYYPLTLCCPGITTLVLLNCCCEHENVAIELDVPRVQQFRFRGKISQFALRSPLPDVRRANLHILACYHSGGVEMCENFWNFLKNFGDTEVLKLKLEWPIDCIAALERDKIRELLIGENHQSDESVMFCVKHLEIDAPHYPESEDVGVAIGNLLQFCPALHDLRLKLNTPSVQPRIRRNNWNTSLQSKAQLEFYSSIDHFRRRRDYPVVPLCGDNGKFEVSDIPGLSDMWFHFSCLPFHLKRFSLQFHMDKDKPNCIGVQLVKFFIERGRALEEMYIDDGHMKLWEHMNCKISEYPSNPRPFSECNILARMSSSALSTNRFSSSKISGWFHTHKLEVRRTNPWSASRSFTILPLADT